MSCSGRPFSAALRGGIIIALGVLLLLEQYGLIPKHWFNFWAMVFLVFGVFHLLQARRWSGRVWALFLIACGASIELDYLGYTQLHLGRTWPVFIIGAGVAILIHSLEKPPGDSPSNSPHLSLLSFMGGGEYRISAKNFRGGSATAIMGGFDIDLRNADIENSRATIVINAFLGGGIIRVPENWAVEMRGASFMGGNSLKVRETGAANKTLVVEGMALLGGFEVRN